MEKKELKVRALPEFIKLFKDSKSKSTQKGRSHFLIKGLGNKKWGSHTKNSRELLTGAQKEIEELNANIMNMKKKLVKLQEVKIENQKHKDRLVKLYDMEVIDSDGEVK